MVEIKQLSFSYRPGTSIFRDFNWNIAPGERWTVIGPSGCGKTTLLYLLAGLYQPGSGKIIIDGTPLLKPRISTGLILQDHGLLPWATAFDNVAVGMKIRRTDKPAAVRKTKEWLSRLGIESIASRYPAEVSRGQRQRVAIARTLVLEPDLLLMDEPFASLDALTREDLQNLTLRLCEKVASTVVLVTHNIEEAALMGKYVMVLSNPPNTSPVIIENASSGYPEYRNIPEFAGKCARLREILEEDLRYPVANEPGYKFNPG